VRNLVHLVPVIHHVVVQIVQASFGVPVEGPQLDFLYEFVDGSFGALGSVRVGKEGVSFY
jgi:hypothetical protein